mgnify:CR=1 FL=1
MCHIICISLTSDLINFKALFIYSVFSFIVFFFYYIFLLLCFLTHHHPRRSYFITFLCIFFYSFFYASSIFITHLSLKTSAFIITKLTGPVMKPGIPYTSSPTNIMTSMAKGDIPSLSPIHFDSIISRTK